VCGGAVTGWRELRDGFALWLKERSARHASAIRISPPPVTDPAAGRLPELSEPDAGVDPLREMTYDEFLGI
jgi:hypothetical protein